MNSVEPETMVSLLITPAGGPFNLITFAKLPYLKRSVVCEAE